MTFALPTGLQQAMRAPNSECSLMLALSAPVSSSIYRFDNIRVQ
jgi:hypothetical protein